LAEPFGHLQILRLGGVEDAVEFQFLIDALQFEFEAGGAFANDRRSPGGGRARQAAKERVGATRSGLFAQPAVRSRAVNGRPISAE
jgi:hypothetical protein